MQDATRPRAFAPMPELATDAEISGLFRLLEQGDSDFLNSTPQRDAECVTPASSSSSPADRDVTRAFAGFARNVAAVLNR